MESMNLLRIYNKKRRKIRYNIYSNSRCKLINMMNTKCNSNL